MFLENEMDVILAHKRSIRLAELAGLSMSGQTTFATAVSEVARSAMEQEGTGQLLLGVETEKPEKFIVAQVRETGQQNTEKRTDGLQYAQRLISNITLSQNEGENNIELRFRIPHARHISPAIVAGWISTFENDLPASPYEEIKRKNRQLANLAEKLRSSEQQYRMLAETLPLLIFSWDTDGRPVYLNKWAQSYTGITPDALPTVDWGHIIYPEEYKDGTLMWPWQLPQQTAESRQVRLKHTGTGEYLWHLLVIMPRQNDEGTVTAWNGFAVDIHAQKMIEQTLKDNQELKRTQAELEANVQQLNQSNEELERFAYIASHDLQEPLRKIIVYSDYLHEKFAHTLNDQGRIFLQNMIRSTARMQKHIRDLLEFSKLGKEPYVPEPVNLNETATEAIADLEVAIRDKKAILNIASLPTIPGNSYQLRQLFQNLISNGLKYAKEGIPPEINIHSQTDETGNILLHFEDNGIGFEAEYADKIFGLFQRLHTREKYEGTGIGLSICKRVAELHGGSISAHSQLNKGANFLVTLPAGSTVH